MTNRSRTLVSVAVLAAASLVGLDAYRRWHDSAAGGRDALLAAMPAEASAVVFADLVEFRRAPFAVEFYNWVPKNTADADYAQFLRETGFDYERDLDRAALAVIKGGNDTRLFALAEGRFDRKKIEAYAAKSGARENRGGREIFFVPLSEARKISFTFLSKDKIAFTDEGDLAALLAPVPASPDVREWRERFTREAGSPIFAVIRQDAGSGNPLASQAPGGFQSPQLSALLDQLQWITLAGKPLDNSLRIVAEGECTSDQTTRQLADFLNGILVMARVGLNGPQTRQQLDPRIRDAYLELIKGTDISRLDRGDTKSVRVVFDVTPKILEAALVAAPTAPTVRDSATPKQAPTVEAKPRKARKN